MKKRPTWREAARRCRLSAEELAMAQELGLNPGALIRNIPPVSGKKEPWKDPPGVRIRKLYEKQRKKEENSMRKKKDAGKTVLNAVGLIPAGLVILLLSLLIRACGRIPDPADLSSGTQSSVTENPAASAYPPPSGDSISSVSALHDAFSSAPAYETACSPSPQFSAAETGSEPGPLPIPSSETAASVFPSSSPEHTADECPETASESISPTPGTETAVFFSSAAASSETTPHVHEFGPWTVTAPPTCLESGAETRTCSVCHETESRPVPAAGHDWHAESIVVQEARTETVKVREAWDEQVLIRGAWTEEITEMHWFCEGCGMDQTVYAREHGLLDADGRWTDEGLEWDAQHAKEHALRGESDRTYSAPVLTDTVEHPAEYAVIHHDGEYETVFIPAETKEIRKCSRCGAVE